MSRKRDHKKYNLEVGRGLALISQLGISFLMPIFLFIWGAKKAVERWSLPKGVILLAVLLGIGVGASSAYRLVQGLTGSGRKERDSK